MVGLIPRCLANSRVMDMSVELGVLAKVVVFCVTKVKYQRFPGIKSAQMKNTFTLQNNLFALTTILSLHYLIQFYTCPSLSPNNHGIYTCN